LIPCSLTVDTGSDLDLARFMATCEKPSDREPPPSDDERDSEDDETPETPPTEAPPVPMKDPPADPQKRGPFTVR
jgi:hypothetical protein